LSTREEAKFLLTLVNYSSFLFTENLNYLDTQNAIAFGITAYYSIIGVRILSGNLTLQH